MANADKLQKARLEKLDKIAALGRDPYGGRFDGHEPIEGARSKQPAESGEAGEAVRVAGRVMQIRKAGKLRFYEIADATGQIQLLFSRGELPEEEWALMAALDYADLVGIDGVTWKTNTGEPSIKVTAVTPLCKALRPPPDKYHGVEDPETLIRQRALDLIYTEGVRDRLLSRSDIVRSVRATLHDRGFVEVETPVLHTVAGGAAARPFTTHHNALDVDLYLRIALELHLKRLMVGGVERVFELGRVFRNEGIDQTHNPEFTMLEVYQAYGDYESMMDLTEAVFTNAVKALNYGNSDGEPSLVVPHTAEDPDGGIDFTPPFPRRKYRDLVNEHAGCDPADDAAVAAKAGELGIEVAGRHPDVILNDVFEATVEPALHAPTFVIDYPASLCPLTKRKADDPDTAERFELFAAGMELANAYTELNDPRLQEELFTRQLEGQAEEDSMAKMDTEFLEALRIGMPPAGGLGIGIDRLCMLLTDARGIRDVIFFPTVKPKG